MGHKSKKTPVTGGWITRESKSGRFVAVSTAKGTSKANPKSQSAVKDVSSKRSAALQRLSNR